MQTGFVIAIDGPAASGKGTIVQLLTEFLSGVNIYTGGMYRALALKCISSHVDFGNQEEVIKVLSSSQIGLGEEDDLGIVAKIYLDGKDVTKEIRIPAVAIGASKIVLNKKVREEMVKRQRSLTNKLVGKGETVILDGQDIGKYVYPEAEMKIFLTASPEVRAKRRQKQYEKQGLEKDFSETFDEIQDRDQRDWSRMLNPLSKNPDKDGYFVVDSTDMNEKQTFDLIVNKLKEKKLI